MLKYRQTRFVPLTRNIRPDNKVNTYSYITATGWYSKRKKIILSKEFKRNWYELWFTIKTYNNDRLWRMVASYLLFLYIYIYIKLFCNVIVCLFVFFQRNQEKHSN